MLKNVIEKPILLYRFQMCCLIMQKEFERKGPILRTSQKSFQTHTEGYLMDFTHLLKKSMIKKVLFPVLFDFNSFEHFLKFQK